MATMSLSPSGPGPVSSLPSSRETQVAPVLSGAVPPYAPQGWQHKHWAGPTSVSSPPLATASDGERNHGNVWHLVLLAWLGSLGQQKAVWRGVA